MVSSESHSASAYFDILQIKSIVLGAIFLAMFVVVNVPDAHASEMAYCGEQEIVHLPDNAQVDNLPQFLTKIKDGMAIRSSLDKTYDGDENTGYAPDGYKGLNVKNKTKVRYVFDTPVNATSFRLYNDSGTSPLEGIKRYGIEVYTQDGGREYRRQRVRAKKGFTVNNLNFGKRINNITSFVFTIERVDKRNRRFRGQWREAQLIDTQQIPCCGDGKVDTSLGETCDGNCPECGSNELSIGSLATCDLTCEPITDDGQTTFTSSFFGGSGDGNGLQVDDPDLVAEVPIIGDDVTTTLGKPLQPVLFMPAFTTQSRRANAQQSGLFNRFLNHILPSDMYFLVIGGSGFDAGSGAALQLTDDNGPINRTLYRSNGDRGELVYVTARHVVPDNDYLLIDPELGNLWNINRRMLSVFEPTIRDTSRRPVDVKLLGRRDHVNEVVSRTLREYPQLARNPQELRFRIANEPHVQATFISHADYSDASNSHATVSRSPREVTYELLPFTFSDLNLGSKSAVLTGLGNYSLLGVIDPHAPETHTSQPSRSGSGGTIDLRNLSSEGVDGLSGVHLVHHASMDLKEIIDIMIGSEPQLERYSKEVLLRLFILRNDLFSREFYARALGSPNGEIDIFATNREAAGLYYGPINDFFLNNGRLTMSVPLTADLLTDFKNQSE